jgi:uncharacterized protein
MGLPRIARCGLSRWAMCALLLAWSLLAGGVRAQALLPVPELTGRVVDQTGVLDAAGRAQLTQALAQIEQTHGSQVVALLVPTTAPEDIAAYAWRVADRWKIGRRDVGDGALIVVALQDRRMRIEVARALEGAVPDLMAKRIIDEQMTPAFRQGQFALGLTRAAQALAQLIAGEGLPAPQAQATTQEGDGAVTLLGALFFAFVIARVANGVLGRPLSWLGAPVLGGAAAWWISGAWIIGLLGAVVAVFSAVTGAMGLQRIGRAAGAHPHGGWGGGRSHGGWGGGGGGFSSGGGGGFGGGGASGGW